MAPYRLIRSGVIAMAMLAFGALLVGCKSEKVTESEPIHLKGNYIASADELNPGASPGTEALMRLAGDKEPVDILHEIIGDQIHIQIRLHGQKFEDEIYHLSGSEFQVLQAAGEHYEPGLPILKFPMYIGDSWEWSGSMVIGERPTPADAVIRSSGDIVFVASVPHDALKSVVELTIDSGASQKATRTLTFWFVPDHGVIKRDFGAGAMSTREPLEQ